MKFLLVFSVLFVTSFVMVAGMSFGSGRLSEKPYLMDFSREGVVEDWRVVNDDVMGGLSGGQIQATPDGTAVFEGRLSLENNGGFASVRASLGGVDLSDRDGISIRVRGDGRTYQIRLRTNQRFDGVSYRATFVTEPGQWKIVGVPFTDFEPTFRGRVLSDVGPLDTAHLQQIAFMVADKKEGPFRLEIEWIKSFVLEEPEPNR